MSQRPVPGPKPSPWSQVNNVNRLFPKDGNNDKSLDEDEWTFFPPVFIFNNACPRRVTNLDICKAACILGRRNVVVAAQRFGPIWHIYPNSLESRALLVNRKLVIGDKKNIEVFSKNPSHLVDEFGRALPATKLFIDKAPVIMKSSVIKEALLQMGVKPRSAVKYERLLDRDEAITMWLSNRRYMFIDIPEESLPTNIEIDDHPIQLFYKEQVREWSDNRQGGQAGVRPKTSDGQRQAKALGPGTASTNNSAGNSENGEKELEPGEIEIEPGEIVEEQNDLRVFKNNQPNGSNPLNTSNSNKKENKGDNNEKTIDLTLPTVSTDKCLDTPRKDNSKEATPKASKPNESLVVSGGKGKKGKKKEKKGKKNEAPIISIWSLDDDVESPKKGGEKKVKG